MKTNFISSDKIPEINYFKTDKQIAQLNDTITISWKTTNADQVILLPFGPVDYEGVKVFEVKTNADALIDIKLLAENTVNGLKCSKAISLYNNQYDQQYQAYLKRKEAKENLTRQHNTTAESNKKEHGISEYLSNKYILFFLSVIFVLVFIAKCS